METLQKPVGLLQDFLRDIAACGGWEQGGIQTLGQVIPILERRNHDIGRLSRPGLQRLYFPGMRGPSAIFLDGGGGARFGLWNCLIELRNFENEDLGGDFAGAVEGVVRPEVGGQRMMRGCGDDAIFEEVVGLQAEDSYGFYADVVISGKVHDGGIGIVGDSAGENVGGAAGSVCDANKRNLDGLEATVEVEIEACELRAPSSLLMRTLAWTSLRESPLVSNRTLVSSSSICAGFFRLARARRPWRLLAFAERRTRTQRGRTKERLRTGQKIAGGECRVCSRGPQENLRFQTNSGKELLFARFLEVGESENTALRGGGGEPPHSMPDPAEESWRGGARPLPWPSLSTRPGAPRKKQPEEATRRNQDWCGASEIMGCFAWMRIRTGLRGE